MIRQRHANVWWVSLVSQIEIFSREALVQSDHNLPLKSTGGARESPFSVDFEVQKLNYRFCSQWLQVTTRTSSLSNLDCLHLSASLTGPPPGR